MKRNSKVLKTKSSDWPMYRRFILLITAIIVILLGTYFVGLAVLSHLSTRDETFTQRDRIAPPPPTLTNIPQATNSAQLKIRGFAEPGSTVNLFLNGEEKDSQLIGSEGQFTFEDITLEIGENEIYATAADSAGNESQPSAISRVTIDREPPKLEVTAPTDNAVIKEEKDKQTFVTVTGKVEEGAMVTVNDYQSIVREEGNFEYRLLLTNDGATTIKIVARDAAGNKTTVEKTVIYKKLGEESED
jgi:hypothetical protein